MSVQGLGHGQQDPYGQVLQEGTTEATKRRKKDASDTQPCKPEVVWISYNEFDEIGIG